MSRVTAAKEADTLEATWGDDTTDEDDGEVARYTRERNQIMEVRFLLFVRYLVECCIVSSNMILFNRQC